MTVFWLKIIACITMICDHIKYVFPMFDVEIMEFLGRMSFPIFAFLITESYTHTKNLKKFIRRLVIVAIISQIPFMRFRSAYISQKIYLNVIFTFLLAIVGMYVLDKNWNIIVKTLIIALIIIIGQILNVDYMGYGVMLTILFYATRDNKIIRNILSTLLIIAFYIAMYRGLILNNMKVIISLIGTLSSLIVINLYNGEEGKKIKYFYYVFYPAHLLLFYLVSLI